MYTGKLSPIKDLRHCKPAFKIYSALNILKLCRKICSNYALTLIHYIFPQLVSIKSVFTLFLAPANEVCEAYVFTPVCQSFCSQGVYVAGVGSCLAEGRVWWGACIVGGMHGRGVHGRGGHAWCGVCMGARACHAHSPDTTRYSRSMRGRYASYWNAFMLRYLLSLLQRILHDIKMNFTYHYLIFCILVRPQNDHLGD